MVTIDQAFAALQISKSATIDEVKAAYKKMALITHPDRGGRAEDFIRIRAAYEILLEYYATSPAPDEYDEVPIPSELKIIIDEIVANFRNIHGDSIQRIKFSFSNLRAECSKKIDDSYIQDLQNFGYTFEKMVNTTVSSVISTTNSNVQGIMKAYDQWFSDSFREIYDELYSREKFQFHKSKDFPKYLFLSLFISSLAFWIFSFLPAILCFGVLQVTSYFYNLTTFAERSFLLKPANFNISTSMVQSISGGIASHVRSFQQAGVMSAVIGMRTGHPVLGAIIAIGAAIASELTGGEQRRKLKASALSTLNKIENDLLSFISGEMEWFAAELNENIIENYKKRNEIIVKMITQKT